MNFLIIFLAILSIFSFGAVDAGCRRTACHTHSARNECDGDEYVGNWGYCWGVAGKWESCCKK